MLKKIILNIFFIIILLLNVTSIAYTTDEQVSITLPPEWYEVEFNENRQYLDTKFIKDENDVESIIFGVTDFYNLNEEFQKYNRKEFNTYILNENDIKEMIGNNYRINKIYKEEIGNNSFWSINCDLKYQEPYYLFDELKYQTKYIPSIININITNGYLTMLLHTSFSNTDNLEIQKHNEILKTIDFSKIENINNEFSLPDLSTILLGIILTFIIYTIIPIIIKLIKKNSITKQIARKIALINSIIIGSIFLIITVNIEGNVVWSAGPALLYYEINYFILTKNKRNIKK